METTQTARVGCSPLRQSVIFLVIPGCLSVLVLTGLPIVSSTTLLLVLALQWLVGAIVHSFFVRGDSLRALDPIHPVLGMLMFSTISQVARIRVDDPFRNIVVLLGACLILVVGVFGRRKTKIGLLQNIRVWSVTTTDVRIALGIITSTLLTLSQTWFWTIPTIAMLTLSISIVAQWNRTRLWRTRIVLLPLLGLSTLVFLQTRDEYWWLPSWGVDENKLFANAFWEWGPFADPLSAGIPIRYQWLGYAVAGDLAKLSNMEMFQFVGRANPVVVSLGLVLLLTAIARELGLDERDSAITPLIAASATTVLSHPVGYSIMPINYFPQAILFIVSWLLLLIRWSKYGTHGDFGLLLILSIASIAAKSVHLVPVTIGIVFVGLLMFRQKRSLILITQLLVAFLSIALYVAVFFPKLGQVGLNSGELFQYLRELGIFPQSVLIRITVGLIHVALVSVPIVITVIDRNGFTFTPIRILLMTMAIPGLLMVIVMSRTSGTHLHFLQVPVTLAITCVPIVFLRIARETDSRSATKPSLVGGFALVALVNTSLHLVTKLITQAPSDRVILTTDALGFLLVVGLSFTLFPQIRKFSWRRTFIFVGTIALTTMTPVNWIVNSYRPIHQTGASYQLGEDVLHEAWEAVRARFGVDAVGSTDIFFDDDRDVCRDVEERGLDEVVREASTTKNFTPAVVIERRFLVVAPLYGFYFSNSDPIDRISLSINFGCNPNRSRASDLRRQGVEWFLSRNVRLHESDVDFAKMTVFSNSRYVLVDLRSLEP